MNIIETTKDKEIFLNYWNTEPCLIIPIWCDLEKHPMNNEISFLYVRFRDDETDQGQMPMDWILPYNHNDCEQLILDISHSIQQKKVWNKKGLLQTNLNIQNTYDLQTEIFFNTHTLLELDLKLEVLTNFYTRMGLRDDLGKSISIMKWNEVLRGITQPISETLVHSISDSWINNTMIPTLSRIEQMGINVVTEKFIDRWSSAQKHLLGETVFTEYNPYTLTSRPSNRHGGVNYGALNKSDGTREIFVPRENTMFLQFDYDAYHVRIIGDLIKYELPTTSAHQWLADQYGCGYAESRELHSNYYMVGLTMRLEKYRFLNKPIFSFKRYIIKH